MIELQLLENVVDNIEDDNVGGDECEEVQGAGPGELLEEGERLGEVSHNLGLDTAKHQS